jgi:hypothetical protein
VHRNAAEAASGAAVLPADGYVPRQCSFAFPLFILCLTLSAAEERGMDSDLAEGSISRARLPDQDVCAIQCQQDRQDYAARTLRLHGRQ